MPLPNANLLNLQKIGKLKPEAPDQREFDNLVQSAGRRLADAERPELASDSRFILAYDAAHSIALAALRWHGFRSELIAVAKDLQAAAMALGLVGA